MRNLTIRKLIKCECKFSAEQWELFTNSFDHDELENVASNINAMLQYYVNSGMNKKETEKHMCEVLQKHSKYGANDSEPHWFLETVLDEIYA